MTKMSRLNEVVDGRQLGRPSVGGGLGAAGLEAPLAPLLHPVPVFLCSSSCCDSVFQEVLALGWFNEESYWVGIQFSFILTELTKLKICHLWTFSRLSNVGLKASLCG